MRSNDSGHATMGNHSPNPSNNNSDGIYSSYDNGSAELRKKSSTSSTSSQYKNIKYLPRPMTVGGIPSSLPSPEYINVATDSTSFHKKTNQSENLNQSQISKEFIATGLDKDRTPSFEPKHNPEYHNLVFEDGKIPSETQLLSNSSAELKSSKGNLKYICVIKRKLFPVQYILQYVILLSPKYFSSDAKAKNSSSIKCNC